MLPLLSWAFWSLEEQPGDGYTRLVPVVTHRSALGHLTYVDMEKLVALHQQGAYLLCTAGNDCHCCYPAAF